MATGKAKAIQNRLRKHYGINAVCYAPWERDGFVVQADTPGLGSILALTTVVHLSGQDVLKNNRRALAALAANKIMRAIKGA